MGQCPVPAAPLFRPPPPVTFVNHEAAWTAARLAEWERELHKTCGHTGYVLTPLADGTLIIRYPRENT